ncbi:MAG: DNA repair protein RecO, partial [Pseudomonadota bacterium]
MSESYEKMGFLPLLHHSITPLLRKSLNAGKRNPPGITDPGFLEPHFCCAMKSHITPSIIMRIKEFGESDLLVTFFTKDMGQMKGVAKGARRSCRRFVNCLDLFSLVNLEFELKREGMLPFIQCGKLIDAFEGLRRDFSALSLASYMIELTETLFPLGVADQNMFQLLKDAFGALAGREWADTLPVVFDLKAMSLGGYRIDMQQCCICGRAYRGQGTAVFIREKGGIACLGCRQISKGAPAIGPESVRM